MLAPLQSDWPARFTTAAYAFGFYLQKTIVPAGLMPLYELPLRVHPFAPRFLLSVIAVALLTGGLVILRRRWPGGLVVWLAYVIMLAPVSLRVAKGHQLVADRYSYLSCLGLALLLGSALCATVTAEARGVLRRWISRVAVAAVALWLAVLSGLTWGQVQMWRDSETLWRWAITVDPTCAICHSQLGSFFLGRGLWTPAIEQFEQTLALRPDLGFTKLALSLALLQAGRPAEAAAQARPVVAQHPSAFQPRTRLGAALVTQGALREGMEQLEEAIRLNPVDAEALTYLGMARTRLGRPAEAIVYFRRAIELSPEVPLPHLGLGRAYLAVDCVAAAEEESRVLRRLDPRIADELRDEALARHRASSLPTGAQNRERCVDHQTRDPRRGETKL